MKTYDSEKVIGLLSRLQRQLTEDLFSPANDEDDENSN